MTIKKFLLGLRYKIILKLIGKMPVIVNCVVDDGVFKYNFVSSIPCIFTKNKIKRTRKGQAFVLDLNSKGGIKCH